MELLRLLVVGGGVVEGAGTAPTRTEDEGMRRDGVVGDCACNFSLEGLFLFFFGYPETCGILVP